MKNNKNSSICLKINLDAEGLHTLGQQCYKHLKNEYFKDEPVEYLFDGQW